MHWGQRKVVTVGKFSELRREDWVKPLRTLRWEKWVARWEGRIEPIRRMPFAARTLAIMGLLVEVEGALQQAVPGAGEAVAVFKPNNANPDNGGLFAGDGHILLNMVLYAGAGFVISLILKYMGRGELSMIVLMITGFVILRQVLFILKELLRDVVELVNF